MGTALKPIKKKANTEFGRFIRLRDCLETTGTVTNGKCFTCDALIPFKGSQPGHFIQGRHNSVLYDERNCHLQCYRCNVPLRANLTEYYPRFEKKYGKEVIEELKASNRQVSHFKWYDYQEIYLKYKAKADEIQGS